MRWLSPLLLAACVHAPPNAQLPFGWEARAIEGEVRVLEAVGAHDALPVDLRSYVGGELPEARVLIRQQRAQELQALPQAVGWALPGALNGQLGSSWSGEFRSAEWPSGKADQLVATLQQGHGLDEWLGDLARTMGGQATLVSWVDRLSARPLSMEGFPGELAQTTRGPVVIDHLDEPFVVDLRVGMALIAADGEVVVRYHQDMVSVLSGARPPDRVGRELAAGVAAEIMKVWHHAPPAGVGGAYASP